MRTPSFVIGFLLLAFGCKPTDVPEIAQDPGPRASEPKEQAPEKLQFEVYDFDRGESPATLLEKNPDGTMLIRISPRPYASELGCTMILTDYGMTSALYTVMDLTIQESKYMILWGMVQAHDEPFPLDPNVEYTFLVKPLNGDGLCVLKAWDGETLLLDRKE